MVKMMIIILIKRLFDSCGVIKGDLISENAKNSLIGRVIKYNSTKKPSIAKALFDLASPLLESSPLGKIATLAGTGALDVMEAHSLKNFI